MISKKRKKERNHTAIQNPHTSKELTKQAKRESNGNKMGLRVYSITPQRFFPFFFWRIAYGEGTVTTYFRHLKLQSLPLIKLNSIAWRIPWTEEPDGIQSMRSQESDTT